MSGLPLLLVLVVVDVNLWLLLQRVLGCAALAPTCPWYLVALQLCVQTGLPPAEATLDGGLTEGAACCVSPAETQPKRVLPFAGVGNWWEGLTRAQSDAAACTSAMQALRASRHPSCAMCMCAVLCSHSPQGAFACRSSLPLLAFLGLQVLPFAEPRSACVLGGWWRVGALLAGWVGERCACRVFPADSCYSKQAEHASLLAEGVSAREAAG
jgi:hypothetical protein